jgi:hypothetical protein
MIIEVQVKDTIEWIHMLFYSFIRIIFLCYPTLQILSANSALTVQLKMDQSK